MNEALFTKFQALGVKVLDVEEALLTPEATFESLGTDSLDLAEFVMALEEEFDIKIAEDELEGLQTVKQAYDLVAAKV
jgi:acyl carrier protein